MSRQLAPAALRKQIAEGALDPLYALVGDDDAGKMRLAALFVEAIEPDFRAFNIERLWVRETRPDESRAGRIVSAARTVPMMAPRRIIIVPDGEQLLPSKRKGRGAGQAAAEPDEETLAEPGGTPTTDVRGPARTRKVATDPEVEMLEAYFRAPEQQTTLVLLLPPIGDADRRRRPLKVLFEQATEVPCGRTTDANEAHAWIQATARRAGMTIESAAARLLAERAAGDRSRLRAEAERAFLYAAGRGRVTLADVQAIVGPPTQRDAWALVRQMEQGSPAGALRELDLLLGAGGVPVMILGQIRSFVERRVAPARLPAAVDALFRTDLALKNSGGDPRVLLERLVVELVGGVSRRPAARPHREEE